VPSERLDCGVRIGFSWNRTAVTLRLTVVGGVVSMVVAQPATLRARMANNTAGVWRVKRSLL
jgi:hypothetical protein